MNKTAKSQELIEDTQQDQKKYYITGEVIPQTKKESSMTGWFTSTGFYVVSPNYKNKYHCKLQKMGSFMGRLQPAPNHPPQVLVISVEEYLKHIKGLGGSKSPMAKNGYEVTVLHEPTESR